MGGGPMQVEREGEVKVVGADDVCGPVQRCRFGWVCTGVSRFGWQVRVWCVGMYGTMNVEGAGAVQLFRRRLERSVELESGDPPGKGSLGRQGSPLLGPAPRL